MRFYTDLNSAQKYFDVWPGDEVFLTHEVQEHGNLYTWKMLDCDDVEDKWPNADGTV